MRSNIIVTIIFTLLISISFPATDSFAQNSISNILEEKKNNNTGMKSRTFVKPNYEDSEKTESINSKQFQPKNYDEIDDDEAKKSNIDGEKNNKQSLPEEDVWEKYKSLAVGKDKKPLHKRSYSLGNKKEFFEEEEEKNDNEVNEDNNNVEIEDKKENFDTTNNKQSKKTGKSGIGSILENYKEKEKTKGTMRNRALNE